MENKQKIIETYRGLDITYNDDKDRFEAKDEHERMRYSEKLSGMRASIDKMLDTEKVVKQTKQEGLYLEDSYEDEFKTRKVTVTSFGKRKNWRGEMALNARVRGLSTYKDWSFVQLNGENVDGVLMKDTPANLAIVKSLEVMRKEKEKADKLYEANVDKARAKLEKLPHPPMDELPIWD